MEKALPARPSSDKGGAAVRTALVAVGTMTRKAVVQG